MERLDVPTVIMVLLFTTSVCIATDTVMVSQKTVSFKLESD